eukprot:scaffold14090_cov106-Isochrysis_galbana.AAC.1
MNECALRVCYAGWQGAGVGVCVRARALVLLSHAAFLCPREPSGRGRAYITGTAVEGGVQPGRWWDAVNGLRGRWARRPAVNRLRGCWAKNPAVNGLWGCWAHHAQSEKGRTKPDQLRRRIKGAVPDGQPPQVDPAVRGQPRVARVDRVGYRRDVFSRVGLAGGIKGGRVEVGADGGLVGGHALVVGGRRVAGPERVVQGEQVGIQVPVHSARDHVEVVGDDKRSELGQKADERRRAGTTVEPEKHGGVLAAGRRLREEEEGAAAGGGVNLEEAREQISRIVSGKSHA